MRIDIKTIKHRGTTYYGLQAYFEEHGYWIDISDSGFTERELQRQCKIKPEDLRILLKEYNFGGYLDDKEKVKQIREGIYSLMILGKLEGGA